MAGLKPKTHSQHWGDALALTRAAVAKHQPTLDVEHAVAGAAIEIPVRTARRMLTKLARPLVAGDSERSESPPEAKKP